MELFTYCLPVVRDEHIYAPSDYILMSKNTGIYERCFEDFECRLVLTFDPPIALRRAFFALSAVDLTILVITVRFSSNSWESLVDSHSFVLAIVFCLFGEENSERAAIIC